MTGFKRISILILFVVPITAFAGQKDTDIIAQLTQEIAAAKTDEEKGRLHMFRARNYRNRGDMEMAEQDYNAALAYDHKGWIHLERSRFYLTWGDYSQAKKEAQAAAKETPTLSGDSQTLITQAEKGLKKEVREEAPQEILLTRRWEVQYSRQPPQRSSGGPNVRQKYYARNKSKAASRPSRVSRS